MASEESPFGRLPPELIISIFDKICDPKFLCVCYSVSKLFAQLVLQTRSVSLQIDALHSYDQIPFWSRRVINFLKQLRCVEYVNVQFTTRSDPERSSGQERRPSWPLLTWKHDSSWFVVIYAKYHSTEDSTVGAAMDESVDEYTDALTSAIKKHIWHRWSRSVYTKALLALFPNLKNVRAVESTEGSVVWEEDGDSMKSEKPLRDFYAKLWSAPLVKLPAYGCAMEDVTLTWVGEILEANCNDVMEKNCTSSEEGEYYELAKIMMKEYACKEIRITHGVTYI